MDVKIRDIDIRSSEKTVQRIASENYECVNLKFFPFAYHLLTPALGS